ncbi:C1 family peptidase [uncultured Hoeflea sp.]|uniref:C1 family peptidase n=1 Tax=uncultured Hoeflea sp. TaxID=538666 RepID=UPI0030EE9C9E|tara:strand:+ start:161979 stop:162950 length:972 start_codon:yes stop_codon:yes gene_type:complete
MVDNVAIANQITVGDFKFFNGGAFPTKRENLKEFLTTKNIETRSQSACNYTIAAYGTKKIDLMEDLSTHWNPRDQRPRGTCTAFAVAACLELLHLRKGNDVVFSTQFLYWNMRENFPDQSIPHWKEGATKSKQALTVLEKIGCCTEEKLQYPHFTDDISGPEPESDAFNEAKKYRARVIDYYSIDEDGEQSNIAEAILQHLTDGLPVAVGLPMYRIKDIAYPNGFTNTDTLITGIVKGPPSVCYLNLEMTAESVSAHQICVVGFQLDSNAPGGGWFIFKNSWGSAFATSPKDKLPFLPGEGYGAISVADVNSDCWEYLCIDLV